MFIYTTLLRDGHGIFWYPGGSLTPLVFPLDPLTSLTLSRYPLIPLNPPLGSLIPLNSPVGPLIPLNSTLKDFLWTSCLEIEVFGLVMLTCGSNCKTFLARNLVSSDCIKIIFGRVFSLTDGQIVMFSMTATDFDNIMRRSTRIVLTSCKNESKIRINSF